MNYKELGRSLISTMKNRITNPFFGALFFSWIIFHWKVIIYLFSSIEPDIKISRIESLKLSYSELIVYPVLSAFIIVFVYPLLGNLSHWVYEIYKTWRIKIDFNINKTAYLPIREAIELKSRIKEIEVEFNQFYNEKRDEIEEIRRDNYNKEKEVKMVIANLEKANNQISELEKTIQSKKHRISELADDLIKLQRLYDANKAVIRKKDERYYMFLNNLSALLLKLKDIDSVDFIGINELLKIEFEENIGILSQVENQLTNEERDFLQNFNRENAFTVLKADLKYDSKISKSLIDKKLLTSVNKVFILTQIGVFYLLFKDIAVHLK